MSTMKFEVTRSGDVRPHPDADALELATVGGQMCVKKAVLMAGSRGLRRKEPEVGAEGR